MAHVLVALLLCGLPIGCALALHRSLRRLGVELSERRFIGTLISGVLLGCLCSWTEREFLQFLGLQVEVGAQGAHSALLAMFVFVAPLEEGAKALGVWPLYVRRKLTDRYVGLLVGVTVACGFAAAEAAAAMFNEPLGGVFVARMGASFIAHAFASGAWGYALGRARGRRFALVWLAATLARGLYDHIVFGRGPGMLVLVLPITVVMVGLGWSAIRDIGQHIERKSAIGVVISLAEPPPLKVLRRALRRSEKPLMLRWIGIGAFVTAGAVLVCLAAGVLIGHRLGIDFSLADEADARSNGPLVLLSAAVMSAFPLSGYLVARASGATTVLEAALGASLTIGIAVVILIMAAPIAVLFALATAPVAFTLVCGGAWLGLSR